MDVNQLSCRPRRRALIEKFKDYVCAYQDSVDVWTGSFPTFPRID
jgi:hypothetical protein